MTIVIGTRGSALAQWQARAVERALSAAMPNERVEVRIISTKGDRILDKPLEQIGDKGLFTRELESALLAGDVDLCVHSMKDMPSQLPDRCIIGAMLPRGDVRDALVCGPRIEATSLADVPQGARLGTGSLRRTAQLRAHCPHIVAKPIRGNVDTRLEKAAGPDYEGVVLAAAGIERIGARERIACLIPVDEMLPAAGQGAIGVEIRNDDDRMARICAAIDDAATSSCVGAERRVLEALEAGCLVPLGVYARHQAGELLMDAGVFSLDGSKIARARYRGANDPDAAADAVVRDLMAAGAGEILAQVRESGALNG